MYVHTSEKRFFVHFKGLSQEFNTFGNLVWFDNSVHRFVASETVFCLERFKSKLNLIVFFPFLGWTTISKTKYTSGKVYNDIIFFSKYFFGGILCFFSYYDKILYCAVYINVNIQALVCFMSYSKIYPFLNFSKFCELLFLQVSLRKICKLAFSKVSV